MSLLDTIRNEFDTLITGHAAELDHPATITITSPLVRAALAATSLPPGMQFALTDLITAAEAEFGQLAAGHAADPAQATLPPEPAAPDVDQAEPAPDPGAAGPVISGTAT